MNQNERVSIVKKSQIDALKKDLKEAYTNCEQVRQNKPNSFQRRADKTISYLNLLSYRLHGGHYNALTAL